MAPSSLHQEVVDGLREAYDGSANARSVSDRTPWQCAERAGFLARLHAEGRQTLFEVGAGAGHDSQFFADNGLQVVATDLSPNMVAICRQRGLSAYVMDVLDLDLSSAAFDAGYSMNSILHVPNADLDNALAAIRRALKPGALFYLGVYGGEEPFEGVLASDWHVPPRFFSFRTDDQLRAVAEQQFRVVDFHVVKEDMHFQALTLRAA